MSEGIVKSLNQGQILDFSKPVDLGFYLEKVSPISPTIFQIIIKYPEDLVIKPGSSIVLTLTPDLGEITLSVNELLEGNRLRVLLGGSKLSNFQSVVISYLSGLLRTNTRLNAKITGKALARSVNNHDVLMIASGTGMTYINPILKYYLNSTISQLEQKEPKKIDLVWFNKNAHQIYNFSEFNALQAVPEVSKFFTYLPLIENSYKHSQELEQALRTQVGTTKQYLEVLESQKTDLFSKLIYIGGSKEFVEYVASYLINNLNADPRKIVSDNYSTSMY